MIIGITGPAGAGKDTLADYLTGREAFVKLSWAGPLKAGLAAMGFPEPTDRALKERTIDGFDFSWRQAAQLLGTEWGRALDPLIWIKIVSRQMAERPDNSYVLSDVRFENEAEAIRRVGGVVVHLQGRRVELGAAAAHTSESGVLIHNDDWVFDNSGTLDELHRQAWTLVRQLHLAATRPEAA